MQIEIDKEKVKALSEEEKAKYGAIGAGLYIKEIEEKYKIETPGEFWRTVNALKIPDDEKQNYISQSIETFKEKGFTNMKDMSDYIRGEDPESGALKSEVSSAIMDTLKKVYPEISEDELVDKFNELTIC